MAALVISEVDLSIVAGIQAAKLPVISEQSVAIGGGSLQSTVIARTSLYRLHADTNCAFRVGSDPTAVATDTPLAAEMPEYFVISAGMKIAVIQR